MTILVAFLDTMPEMRGYKALRYLYVTIEEHQGHRILMGLVHRFSSLQQLHTMVFLDSLVTTINPNGKCKEEPKPLEEVLMEYCLQDVVDLPKLTHAAINCRGGQEEYGEMHHEGFPVTEAANSWMEQEFSKKGRKDVIHLLEPWCYSEKLSGESSGSDSE